MAITKDWLLWAALSAVFAAFTAIFTKVGVRGVNSHLAALIHTFVILLMLLVANGLLGSWGQVAKLRPSTIGWLVASGLATGASWLCYFRALQLGDASQVAPVDKASVVLIALLAFAFLGERPTWREWLGIILVSGGVLLLSIRK